MTTAVPPGPGGGRARSTLRWHRPFMVLAGGVVGVFLCQVVPGALIAVGWVQALAQRLAVRQWAWRRRRLGVGEMSVPLPRLVPPWILPERHPGIGATLMRGGLIANLLRGGQFLFTALVVTLPGSLLMSLGWWGGWNVSYYKGYEQSAIGAQLSLAGMTLWVLAMAYVPLAQARQAATGEWGAFFDFRRVRQVIGRRWIATAFLTAAYGALSLPLLLMGSALGFGELADALVPDGDPERAAEVLGYYFLALTALVLPAFTLLKVVAAQIYAAGAWELAASGAWPPGQWRGAERDWLQAPRPDAPPSPAPLWRRWLRIPGRGVAAILVAVLWYLVISQTYVTQFFAYQPAIRWFNHGLVHLPWVRVIPDHLGEN